MEFDYELIRQGEPFFVIASQYLPFRSLNIHFQYIQALDTVIQHERAYIDAFRCGVVRFVALNKSRASGIANYLYIRRMTPESSFQ